MTTSVCPNIKKNKAIVHFIIGSKNVCLFSIIMKNYEMSYVYMSLHQYFAVYMVWHISVCHEIPEALRHILTLRLLMSYIYGAPILDVSRSHTMTQHSR